MSVGSSRQFQIHMSGRTSAYHSTSSTSVTRIWETRRPSRTGEVTTLWYMTGDRVLIEHLVRGINPLTPPNLLQHEIAQVSFFLSASHPMTHQPPDRKLQVYRGQRSPWSRLLRPRYWSFAPPPRHHWTLLHPRSCRRPRLRRPTSSPKGTLQRWPPHCYALLYGETENNSGLERAWSMIRTSTTASTLTRDSGQADSYS